MNLRRRNRTQKLRADIMMRPICHQTSPPLLASSHMQSVCSGLDQRLNVWAPMFIVVTVKTLLSDVLRPVEVASFRANVLAKVVSAASSVIVVSEYTTDAGQLTRHKSLDSSQHKTYYALRRYCHMPVLDTRRPFPSPAPGRKRLTSLRLASR